MEIIITIESGEIDTLVFNVMLYSKCFLDAGRRTAVVCRSCMRSFPLEEMAEHQVCSYLTAWTQFIIIRSFLLVLPASGTYIKPTSGQTSILKAGSVFKWLVQISSPTASWSVTTHQRRLNRNSLVLVWPILWSLHCSQPKAGGKRRERGMLTRSAPVPTVTWLSP